jgi:signal transduction histidine kinase
MTVPNSPDPAAGNVANPDPVLRRLAASLAHNVNNALTGVIGYLELALRDSEPNTVVHERLQASLKCAFQVAETVRRIVTFALRPPAGVALMPLSLREVAEHAARQVRDRPDAARYAVAVHGDATCWVQANAPLLQVVLEHLVANALEAMPQGGRLTLRAWEEGGRCCLSVNDTGKGMPAAVLEQPFAPFLTTKASGHLGLGLVFCRDAMLAQGGELTVAESSSQGTTVVIAFPALREADQPGPAGEGPFPVRQDEPHDARPDVPLTVGPPGNVGPRRLAFCHLHVP